MILNSLHSSTGNTKLESDVFDHFHQILFQIDQHREELKKRIDDIALAMIDEIKKKEAMYLNELKKRFPPRNFFLEDLLEKKAMILSQGLVKLRGAFLTRSCGLGVYKILARKLVPSISHKILGFLIYDCLLFETLCCNRCI
jgi:hypothetical protein